MAYTIELQLGGDALSQLERIEAKLRSIQTVAKSIHFGTATGTGGARVSSNLNPNGTAASSSTIRGLLPAYNAGTGTWYAGARGISSNLSEVEQRTFAQRMSRFGNWATRPMGTQQTGGRNFYGTVGTMGVLSGLGQIATGNMQGFERIGQGIGIAIAPKLANVLAAAVSTPVGAAMAAIAAIPLAGVGLHAGVSSVGGKVYNRFNEMLFDERMSTAIGNVTLGRYAAANVGAEEVVNLNRLSENLQNLYGVNKGQAAMGMQLFSNVTGTGVGMGAYIMETVAKMSMMTGAPIEKLITNTSQILSVVKPSMRDIREQNQSTKGLVANMALSIMKERGINGDPLAWLRDRSNMLETMFRIGQETQLTGAARARGVIRGAETDVWSRLAGRDNFWSMFGQASKATFGAFGSAMEAQMSYWEQNPVAFNEIITEFAQFGTTMTQILPQLGQAFTKLAGFMDWLGLITLPNTMPEAQRAAALTQAREDFKNETRDRWLAKGWSSNIVEQMLDPIVNQVITEQDLQGFGNVDKRDVLLPAFDRLQYNALSARLQVYGRPSNSDVISTLQSLQGGYVPKGNGLAQWLKLPNGNNNYGAMIEDVQRLDSQGMNFFDILYRSNSERKAGEQYFGKANIPTQTYYSAAADKLKGTAGWNVLSPQAQRDAIDAEGAKMMADLLKTNGTGGTTTQTNVNGNVNRQVYINFNAPLSDQTITITTSSPRDVADAIRNNRDDMGLRVFAEAMMQVGAVIQARGT